jgi:RNA polymerase sigma-70 factor (ECF subfamily)
MTAETREENIRLPRNPTPALFSPEQKFIFCKLATPDGVYTYVDRAAVPMVMTADWENHAITDNFEFVFRLHQGSIFRFVLASLRDRDVAETLTQDCFLKAYNAREQFRGDSSLRTWLMQIAVNLVRDYARNRRLQFWRRAQSTAVEIDVAREWLPDKRSSPETVALARERLAAVFAAVEKLSERQRTVFLLRFVEEMQLLEIAAATGMKEGTVKVHLSRALAAIRERIGGAL